MHQYHTLEDLLEQIKEPNKEPAKRLYQENVVLFQRAPGSKTKHQAWEGGYQDHVTEIMNISIKLYNTLNACRPLPFSLSDSLLVLYLHDLEKPWKYGDEKKQQEFRSFSHYHDFIDSKIREYGFQLTDDHKNGLKYVHGEGDDYDPKVRIQTPLAAFANACDNISARVWFNQPEVRGLW